MSQDIRTHDGHLVAAVERREHPRFDVDLIVAVTVTSVDELLDQIVRDLSMGGVQLRLDRDVAAGIRLHLRGNLPDGALLLAIDGVVRWCRPDGKAFLVGVEFAALAGDAELALRQLVQYDKERRSHRRVPYSHSIRLGPVFGVDAQKLKGVDLSLGGLRANVDRHIEPGAVLILELVDAVGSEPLRVEGVVRWCRDLGGGEHDMGLAFRHLDANAQAQLARIVQHTK